MCVSLCVFGCVYVYFAHKLKPFLTHRRCCRRMTPLYVCMHMFMCVCMFVCSYFPANDLTPTHTLLCMFMFLCSYIPANNLTPTNTHCRCSLLTMPLYVCICLCVYLYVSVSTVSTNNLIRMHTRCRWMCECVYILLQITSHQRTHIAGVADGWRLSTCALYKSIVWLVMMLGFVKGLTKFAILYTLQVLQMDDASLLVRFVSPLFVLTSQAMWHTWMWETSSLFVCAL